MAVSALTPERASGQGSKFGSPQHTDMMLGELSCPPGSYIILDCGLGKVLAECGPLQPELGKEEHSVFVVAPGPLPHVGMKHSTSPVLPSHLNRAPHVRDEVGTTGLHVETIGQKPFHWLFCLLKKRTQENGDQRAIFFLLGCICSQVGQLQNFPDFHCYHF